MNKRKNKIKPEIENEDKQKHLLAVVEALNTVHPDTIKMVKNIARGLSDIEIVHQFNQAAQDFFKLLTRLTRETGQTDDYGVAGYMKLFNHAIGIRKDWPIDKFTLLILEFAPQVYEEDEAFFLNCKIPETQVKVTNEFGIIKTEMFKQLWIKTTDQNRTALKDVILLLVTYAHAYFIKAVNSNMRI